jgi:hypothetical protein
LSRWITSRFWCGILHRGKIACSNGMNMFVTKWSLFILVSFGSLPITLKPLVFHMIVNIKFLFWISSLGFVITSSLDRVHMRYGNIFKKNHNSSPVTRWCRSSYSTTYKNANIAFAYSFHFSCKSCVNRCGTQCKWNDLKPIKSCKCGNTDESATHSISAIERVDLKGNLSNIAIILWSRLSKEGLLVRISSWRSWRSSHTSVIHN